MLFCSRKPPKTGDSSNESTHYQRAYKKNVIIRPFSTVVDENRKYCLARGIDDKAYIRPGTSEGFETVRNNESWCQLQKIKSESSQIMTGQKKVYVTPSTHRLLSKDAVIVDGAECFVNSDDIHNVFARPKYYAECNGTTWANETECLWCMMQGKLKVLTCKKDTSIIYSQEFLCIYVQFCDN